MVVREGAESEGSAFDSFYEVVDRFGGSVRDPGAVPVHDRGVPAGQGAAQTAQLGRAVGVAEVVGEFAEVGAGELRAVDVIEAAEYFFGVPRQADVAAGIAGGEQTAELGVAGFAEALVGRNQQPARPPQRVILAVAVTERVVLGAAADLVDAVVRQADHVERIGDLADLGQRHVEGAPIRPREIQDTPVDALTPRLRLRQQAADRSLSVTTRDNVEQLAPGHVHDRGAPPAGPPGALAPQQCLIEPQRLHGTDSVTVSGQQRFAPGEHRPVHRMPVTTHSPATSVTGRASRPTAIVAQHPARAVNVERAGAIHSSTSVNETIPQLVDGQRHRHLCHTRRTGRPTPPSPPSSPR